MDICDLTTKKWQSQIISSEDKKKNFYNNDCGLLGCDNTKYLNVSPSKRLVPTYNTLHNVHTSHCCAFMLSLLPWKQNNTFPLYCCWHRCSYQQYELFSVTMEIQQWFHFKLLSSYKIFCTAVINNKYSIL
jgi:hypothetical protein